MAEEQQMSKEEQIGFHKGSLSTLAKEREELARILGIVEQLMQMHVNGLKEMGVDLEKDSDAPSKPIPVTNSAKKPIEDIL